MLIRLIYFVDLKFGMFGKGLENKSARKNYSSFSVEKTTLRSVWYNPMNKFEMEIVRH